ncbi:C40 family peptidase [Chitinibacter tainanensis]|uniref:C40 family peptidase n=1 Tax=Chitinibacter tainanensis TaxID=230667 RepID=UPI002354B574|nr:C40 family peptidase [Chitinibacter tainanensis]
MKWIIILATVCAAASPWALADQDMPLGDSTPPVLKNAESLNLDDAEPGSPANPKPRKAKSSSNVMPKGTDYTPAQDLLLSAMSLIGVKYTWGGNSPESGLDCSGFIKYVFQNSMNITLPRTALGMSQTGQTIDKDELKPGDLVFFNTLGRTFSHVGIYLGDNRFIHAPRKGRNIEVANMNLSYWQTRFNGARRIADGGGKGLNVNALFAAAPNSASSKAATNATSSSARNDEARSSQQRCTKITTGKGKKRKTVMQCSPRSSAEQPSNTRKGKASASRNKGNTKAVSKANKSSSKKAATKTAKKKK